MRNTIFSCLNDLPFGSLFSRSMAHAMLVVALLGLSACSDDDDDAPVDPGIEDPVDDGAGDDAGDDSSDDDETGDDSSDDDAVPDPVKAFSITVKNITNNQPLSPAFIAIHSSEATLWTLGSSASVELEDLAESGDVSSLAAALDALSDDIIYTTATGTGIIASGAEETLSLTIPDDASALLSFASMLVNTNDAFAGLSSYDIASMAVDETRTVLTHAWDAGTEGNDELQATIPGPAAGGEGFNAERNDVDFVFLHPGVLTSDDGLASSILTESHQFNSIVVALTIQRTE